MAFLKMEDINYIEESELDNTFSKDITTESYFSTSLETISKLNKEYRDASNKYYSSINESGITNINIVFRDFISSVNSIIFKFNKCIKDNRSNFISSLKRQMDNNNITLDKDKITNIKAGNIYNYTISDDIPKIIGRDMYYEEIDKLEKILKNNSISQDQKVINLLFIYNELMEDLKGSFYDRFRGKILNLKRDISALEFGDELFNIYRDGGHHINVILEKEEILEIYKRFKNARNYIISIERQKDNIIKEYERIRKDISNIKLTDVANMLGTGSDMLDNRLQLYIKAKTEQIINMCSIYNMAYTAKLDASASLYLQDKAILTAVVNKYTPAKSEDEEVIESYSLLDDLYE